MPSIIISKNGKNAKKIEKSDLESESVLQEYIYNNPEAIPIDEIENGLKLFVAAREFQVGSGRIDALGFDQHGNIYVIETKLARNADKRSVIAQVLDYGANLWSFQNADDFFTEISVYTSSAFGKDFQSALCDYYGFDNAEEIISNIKNNLASGNIRFIVMMDEVEPHLKDMVRFINQNSKYDIYAVETAFYRNDDQEIMTAEMFGDEVKKEMGIKIKSDNVWSECKETEYVKAVCELDYTPQLKEQILKLTGILKCVARRAADGDLRFWHVTSSRMDDYRIGTFAFYMNHTGTMNVFINGPEIEKKAKITEFFRAIYEEMDRRKVFSTEGADRLKQFWLVTRGFNSEEYKRFVGIFEDVAREKGYIDEYSERDFLNFVDGLEWVNAETYKETSPHEYIVVKPNTSSREDFLKALRFLFENGVEEPFYQQKYMSYIVGGRKYWSMEQSYNDVDDETCILNRTRPEDTFKIYE